MSTYTPMKKNQTTTPTEIIGFDLGHAETAATITMLGATKDPDPLEIQGDKEPIITAVAKDREGNVRIGEEAYRSRNLKSLQVMFKSPNLDDPEIRTPLQLFVQKIVTLWLEGKDIDGGNDSLFIVGCPSGWDHETRAAYAALLRDTGMKQVQVERESRGAFLAARDWLKVSVDTLSGSVLIVDIGSSTTDFTHVVNMEEKPEDFGSNVLGAGIIDRIIFERWRSAQDNAADITTMFKEFPYLEAVCLLHCRKLKEKYFKTNRTAEEPVYLDERILFEGKTIPFSMELLDRDMDEIISTPIGEFLQQPNAELRKLGWQDAFRKVLQNAREQTADDPPQMILLTGGASRMSFVLRCCEEEFPSAEVKRGKDPQYTIARGLALIGRTGNKLEKFRKEIKHVLESGQLQKAIQTDSLKKLIDGIVNFLVPELERVILSAFRDWRNGAISTLNDMESETERRIKQYLESLKKRPGAKKLKEKVIEDWIDTSVKPVVNDLFTPICEKAGIPDSSLSLPRDFSAHALHVRAMPSSDIEATDSLDNLSLIAAAIGSVIIATLLGGSGAALLMSGPVGWILGLIIGAIVMFVGRKAARGMVQDADIPEFLRQMMTSEKKVRNKLRENRSELRRQLSTALRKNASAFDETINRIAEMVKDELEKKAKKAAMLIK